MANTIFAAIDIGAYEVSMKIFEMSKKDGMHELNHVRYRLELGKGAYNSGKLEAGAMEDLCSVLMDFQKMMKEFGVEEYRCCATSAFRELKYPLISIEQVYRRTGMRIEVLNYSEQHFLGYKSIAAMENGFNKMIQKGTAILDVGGGSIQVSLFDRDALVSTQHLKMGSLRIREKLRNLEKQTIHYDQLVKEFIRNDLTNFQRLYLKDKEVRNVILLGDFLTDTIFHADMRDAIITREEFNRRYEAIMDKPAHMLAKELNIDPEYATLVVPTMVIYQSFLDLFGAEAMWAPGIALVDGIAFDYGERCKFLKSEHKFENDILVASTEISHRYAVDHEHIKGTAKLALAIFDSTKKIHGMGSRERLMLQIAVQLHDCGKYLSMSNVAENSYRIIMETEIIGLSNRERSVIGHAVRYNTSEFPSLGDMNLDAEIDTEQYLLIGKLTAILRLANAMDRSHYQKVEKMKASYKDGALQLSIDSTRDFSLEMGLLKDKVEFFEEVFGIKLVLRRKKKIQ